MPWILPGPFFFFFDRLFPSLLLSFFFFFEKILWRMFQIMSFKRIFFSSPHASTTRCSHVIKLTTYLFFVRLCDYNFQFSPLPLSNPYPSRSLNVWCESQKNRELTIYQIGQYSIMFTTNAVVCFSVTMSLFETAPPFFHCNLPW